MDVLILKAAAHFTVWWRWRREGLDELRVRIRRRKRSFVVFVPQLVFVELAKVGLLDALVVAAAVIEGVETGLAEALQGVVGCGAENKGKDRG